MAKGRPVKSVVREGITEILYHRGPSTGYDVAKVYNSVFPAVTVRVIYYNLKKGLELGIYRIDKIKKEEGEYSWGPNAEKIYYALTDKAMPKGNARVKEFIDHHQR